MKTARKTVSGFARGFFRCCPVVFLVVMLLLPGAVLAPCRVRAGIIGGFELPAGKARPKPWPAPNPGTSSTVVTRPGATFTEPATGMEFVWVPGGCFMMGQSETEKKQLIEKVGREKYEKYYADELPRHKVCVDGFWMGRYEVTVGQWRRFVEATGYRTEAERNIGKKGSYAWHRNKDGNLYSDWGSDRDWRNPGFEQSRTHPVCCVSYNDVQKFIVWLARQSSHKFRLPTEAEWEYACRAGTTTAYFWGDDLDQVCAYGNVADQTFEKYGVDIKKGQKHECSDGYVFPAPVGSFKPNAFGLYDMLGNVWEWCADWYGEDYYSHSPERNPRGPETGSDRVFRVGCWLGGLGNVRSANRGRFRPFIRGHSLGFRLVAQGGEI